MTARTSTDTGHFSTQPGLGHSMQRSDSWRACSGGKPRLTSWKLCARTCGSCSGTRWRGSLARSFAGSGLLLGFFCFVSGIGHPHARTAARHTLLLRCVRLLQSAFALLDVLANLLQFSVRIGLQPLYAQALLLAIHVVALGEH